MAAKVCFDFLKNTLHHLNLNRTKSAPVFTLQTNWARKTLHIFGITVNTKGLVSSDEPLLLIGNHVSYLDIPLLMSVANDISFVAKKELSSWPLFGHAANVMKTIYVDRGSTTSRKSARLSIQNGLKNKQRIVIFPSGTTSLDESTQWRLGAFEIAAEMGIKVQPFRLTYSPLRQAAFINDDFFVSHLYNVAKNQNINAYIEFHSPVIITDPAKDCMFWQQWSQNFMQN